MKGKLFPVIAVIIIFVSLLVGVFYWFEWRTQGVRKKCFTETINLSKEVDQSTDSSSEEKTTTSSSRLRPLSKEAQSILEGKYVSQTEKNNFYRLCLAKNGLKPESLFVNIEK